MRKRFGSILWHLGAAALLWIASGPAGSALAEPQSDVHNEPLSLGLVTATDAVDVGSDEVASPLSSFAYFSGQRIATSSKEDSRLVLTLDDGSLSLGPDSAAVVTGTPGQYRVTLENGALMLRFGASADFEVAANDVRIRRVSGASKTPVEASLQLDDSGALTVVSQRGVLEASELHVAGTSVLEPGALGRFGVGGHPDVAARDDESVGWLTRAAYAGGGLAVFGGVAGLAIGLSGDNNNDDPVTSPVVP